LLTYILHRFYQSLLVIVGVTLVTFLILHFLGDPVQLLLPPGASAEMMDRHREQLGLNDPLPLQYLRMLSGLVAGDIGDSYYYKESALAVVLERFPATLELTAAGLVMALVLGIPAGIVSAMFHNKKTDYGIRILALLGQCVPIFWVGILLIILFAVTLHWLPTSGRGSWQQVILPAFALGLYPAAAIIRLLRSSMLEVLNKPYILVARAKGLSKRSIILKHSLKNALSSVVTVLGLHIADMLGGAIVIETVFAWPGIGRLAIQSINNRDFTVVVGVVILVAICYVVINLLVDIVYAILNPRIKLQKEG